jgi:hypothetical protein
MLGSSSNMFETSVSRVLRALSPSTVLDVGAGEGKLGLLGSTILPSAKFTALQKLFVEGDAELLRDNGYLNVIDSEIYSYMREGFDERYSLATICDVIEHFVFSDAMSILKFLAYRCDWILLIWPSRHPQDAVSHSFDRHRFSMSPLELFHHFDVVRYEQSGFSNLAILHSYHLALIRGDMNINTVPAF